VGDDDIDTQMSLGVSEEFTAKDLLAIFDPFSPEGTRPHLPLPCSARKFSD
jgi:hypothetical protein